MKKKKETPTEDRIAILVKELEGRFQLGKQKMLSGLREYIMAGCALVQKQACLYCSKSDVYDEMHGCSYSVAVVSTLLTIVKEMQEHDEDLFKKGLREGSGSYYPILDSRVFKLYERLKLELNELAKEIES